jgi:hypothetical protein
MSRLREGSGVPGSSLPRVRSLGKSLFVYDFDLLIDHLAGEAVNRH